MEGFYMAYKYQLKNYYASGTLFQEGDINLIDPTNKALSPIGLSQTSENGRLVLRASAHNTVTLDGDASSGGFGLILSQTGNIQVAQLGMDAGLGGRLDLKDTAQGRVFRSAADSNGGYLNINAKGSSTRPTVLKASVSPYGSNKGGNIKTYISASGQPVKLMAELGAGGAGSGTFKIYNAAGTADVVNLTRNFNGGNLTLKESSTTLVEARADAATGGSFVLNINNGYKSADMASSPIGGQFTAYAPRVGTAVLAKMGGVDESSDGLHMWGRVQLYGSGSGYNLQSVDIGLVGPGGSALRDSGSFRLVHQNNNDVLTIQKTGKGSKVQLRNLGNSAVANLFVDDVNSCGRLDLNDGSGLSKVLLKGDSGYMSGAGELYVGGSRVRLSNIPSLTQLTLVGTDFLTVQDANDGLDLKKMTVSDYGQYLAGTGITADGDGKLSVVGLPVGTNNWGSTQVVTVLEGLNYWGGTQSGGEYTANLPDTRTLTVGDTVIIKAPRNAGTYNVNIVPSGTAGNQDEIDFSKSTRKLESDDAAVTLVVTTAALNGGTWILH